MSETIIGIDPDSNGAVVILWPETTGDDKTVMIESLCLVAPGEVDLSWLEAFFVEWVDNLDRDGEVSHCLSHAERRNRNPVCAYLERQKQIVLPPKKGWKTSKCPTCKRLNVAVHTSLVLCAIENRIIGLLAGMKIPMESIPPGSWKKAFVRGKEAMLPVASRMFPSVTWPKNKLKAEGQATALMLAEWGRREREGRPI